MINNNNKKIKNKNQGMLGILAIFGSIITLWMLLQSAIEHSFHLTNYSK
jgi:uncharacterized membrane protein YjfL (UPF0719 family)